MGFLVVNSTKSIQVNAKRCRWRLPIHIPKPQCPSCHLRSTDISALHDGTCLVKSRSIVFRLESHCMSAFTDIFEKEFYPRCLGTHSAILLWHKTVLLSTKLYETIHLLSIFSCTCRLWLWTYTLLWIYLFLDFSEKWRRATVTYPVHFLLEMASGERLHWMP